MKVYELMSLLGEAKASDDVHVNICITVNELMRGINIDGDLYSLTIKTESFDPDTHTISTE